MERNQEENNFFQGDSPSDLLGCFYTCTLHLLHHFVICFFRLISAGAPVMPLPKVKLLRYRCTPAAIRLPVALLLAESLPVSANTRNERPANLRSLRWQRAPKEALISACAFAAQRPAGSEQTRTQSRWKKLTVSILQPLRGGERKTMVLAIALPSTL